MTPWTVAHLAPLSMGFSRQEYWSGLPCPPPGDLPNPGIELRSPALQADSLTSEPPGKSESESCSIASDSLRPYGLYSPWNSPDQNTGVGSLSLLQGMFPTLGSNPGLLNYRQILLPAEPHQGIKPQLILGLFKRGRQPELQSHCLLISKKSSSL